MVSDGSFYTSDEYNAAIFSKADLVFCGNGKLKVEANYNDGITSKDGLIVYSGAYEIISVDDGLRGKDFLVLLDGTFNIHSGGDALLADNEESGSGYIDIYKGNFTLNSGGDGLSAEN